MPDITPEELQKINEATQAVVSQYFTMDELQAIAARNKSTLQGLAKQWAIRKGTSVYLLESDGYYGKPVPDSELELAFRAFAMPRVPGPGIFPAGIEWEKPKPKSEGEMMNKTVKELMFEYGQNAKEVVADMSLKRSYFDATTGIFYEAVCPLADIKPVFHPQIDEWLRLLGGQDIDKLLDWIATVKDLTKPTSALMLIGFPGAGKELFVQGLTRLWKWSKAPTELGRVLGNFNEDIARTPMVFCDEKLPTGFGGKDGILDIIKNMIAKSSHVLSRKHISNCDLNGSLRFVFAANSADSMFDIHEEQNGNQRESVTERFLYIQVSEEPTKYLRSIGGRNATQPWVQDNWIAEHATWLAENRKVNYGPRFIVHGDAQSLQRGVLVGNNFNSMILEFLVRWIDKGSANTKELIVGNNAVLVNPDVIRSQWSQFVSDLPISTNKIGRVLSNLSVKTLNSAGKEEDLRLVWPAANGRNTRIRYHSIDVNYIYEWCRQQKVGDVDYIRERIETPVDIDKMRGGGSSGSGGSGGTSPGQSQPRGVVLVMPQVQVQNTAKSLMDN